MSLKVIKQTVEIEELAGAQSAQIPLRAEALVPGAGREAIEVLLAEASLVLGNVDVQTDRVVIDGTVPCQVVYRQGEESTLRGLEAQTSLSHVFDMTGVRTGQASRARGQVEHVEARYENGHMVFAVSVLIAVEVLRLSPVEAVTGLEGLEGLEAETEELTSWKLAAENGVQAEVAEEVSLPAALDARMALMDWAAVQVEQVKPDLGGVRVTGKVEAEVLVSSGVAGRPVALVKYPLAFDQLLEMPDWLAGHVEAQAELTRLDAQVRQGGEQEDSVLRIEAGVRISLRAMTADTVSVLRDAYLTSGGSLDLEYQTVRYAAGIQQVRVTEAFRGTVLLPEGAPGVGTVLAARVRPSLGEWRSERGMLSLDGVLEASVLYMPAGSDKLASAQTELPFHINCQGSLDPEAWLRVEAVGAEATALMSDRVELRCELLVQGEAREPGEAVLVREASEGETRTRRPGFLLYWPGKEDTAWSVGKRYGVPVRQVLEMNGGEEGIRPGKALVLKI